MSNGFELQPHRIVPGRLVYASNPNYPGVIVEVQPAWHVRVVWITGRISEQSANDLHDFDLRVDTYSKDLASYQDRAVELLARVHP